MGFENRKHSRVKVEGLHLYFWTEGRTDGPGSWAQSVNLSESGMALLSAQGVAKGTVILLELSFPGREKPLRLFAEVVHTGREQGREQRHDLRVKFTDLQPEEKLALKQYILQAADPKLAAATGWGRAHFHGKPVMESTYREISQSESKQLYDARVFLSSKEVGYLKRFQVYLEHVLGSRNPENFRLHGSKALKDHSAVWVELGVERGPLHVLGKVLWSKHEAGHDAESGVCVTAFQKDEAFKFEKG